MSAWSLLVFLLIGFAPSEVLVLRNGKKMLVERYEKQGQQLRVYAKGEAFMLPERMIDWEASAAEKENMAKRAAEREAAAKAALEKKKEDDIWRRLPNPDKPASAVVLTNRDYQEMTGKQTGPIQVGIRKMGNTILVSALINKQGPYDFVLDTGAEVTVIDPAIASRVGAQMTGRYVKIVGVGGQAIDAPVAELNQIALDNAKVDDLQVTLKAIPQLNQLRVAGLLGQDFLNHFTVNLDTNANRLTLTPSGISSDSPALAQLFEDLPDPQLTMSRLEAVQKKLDYLYKSYRLMVPQTQPPNTLLRSVKELNAELPGLKLDIDKIYRFIGETPEDRLNPAERENRRVFLKCRAPFQKYLTELQQFSQEMGRAYSDTRTELSMNQARGRLDMGMRELMETATDLNTCF